MRRPHVSVCVPTYNGESYLRESLESIQNQTLTDFEVILVDDDSTDASHSMALEFARRDSRFHPHRNEKRLGLVGNWNRSLELASGEWIKFLFQDDLMEADCLEKLVGSCERERRPFGFCHRHILFEGEVSAPIRNFFQNHQAEIAKTYGTQTYMDGITFAHKCVTTVYNNLVGEPTVTIFNRSVIKDFGVFNPALIQACDSEYWTRVATNAGIVHVPEKLATFRVHGKSTTSHNAQNRKYRNGMLDPLIVNYLLLHGSQYGTMRKALYDEIGRLKAWRQFLHSVYSVWREAHPLFLNFGSKSAAMRAEWNNVTGVYPKLSLFVFLGFCYAAIRAAVRPGWIIGDRKPRT